MIYEEEIKSLAEGKAKGKRIVLMGRLEHLEAIGKVSDSVDISHLCFQPFFCH